MASNELLQAVMRLTVDRLKGRNVGFGDLQVRPESHYQYLGLPGFARYVWDRAERLRVIPPEADWIEDQFNKPQIPPAHRPEFAAKAFLKEYPTARHRFESLANYADLYGLWVESLKRGAPSPSLTDALCAWARNHIPSDCLAQVGLDTAVTRLVHMLQGQVGSYRFDQDLLQSWMIPSLVRAQLDMLRGCRPEIDPKELRPILRIEAERILGSLSGSFGIDRLKAEDVVERALFSVIQAEGIVYRGHRDRIQQWALEVLKAQIKLAASFYCPPRMDMRGRWGLEVSEDRRELKKREVFLLKYSEIV